MYTVEDIKRARGICCNLTTNCDGCPLLPIIQKNSDSSCKLALFTAVIELLEKQEDEINRLQQDFNQLQSSQNRQVEDFAKQLKGEFKNLHAYESYSDLTSTTITTVSLEGCIDRLLGGQRK